MICATPACHRRARRNFANCDAHTSALLTGAFGIPSPVPQAWHDRARARVGRTAIVGGLPKRAEVVPSDRRAPQDAVSSAA